MCALQKDPSKRVKKMRLKTKEKYLQATHPLQEVLAYPRSRSPFAHARLTVRGSREESTDSNVQDCTCSFLCSSLNLVSAENAFVLGLIRDSQPMGVLIESQNSVLIPQPSITEQSSELSEYFHMTASCAPCAL